MSEISKQALKVDNSTSFPDNNTGYISPSILRSFNVNMIDSLVEQEGYTADSGSWNVSIGQLNSYTASFAPSLDALNDFTASQLATNNVVNQFTQSAGAQLATLNAFSASFNPYTASINQIRSNGVTLGTSTIFNLVGPGTFFSASLVQNVQGDIATLTFTSDSAKLNTSSFNEYTQSTNAFTASATQSIQQLLNFSSSLDATYATDAQLQVTASALQLNIDTKLSTDAFNIYTQSANSNVNSLTESFNQFTSSQNLLNGTFATTGSNTFMGNQIVNAVGGGPSITANGGFVTDGIAVYNQYGNIKIAGNGSNSGSQYPTNTIVVDPVTYAFDGVFAGYQVQYVQPDGNPYTLIEMAANSYTPEFGGYPNGETVSWIGAGGANANGSNTAIIFRTGSADMLVYKPTTFNYPVNITGSLTLTGSVYQNVNEVSIVSSTASIDLSQANYFTLTLAGTTKINVINPQPGVTATLVINTSTAASASFSSNVKQPSGSFYAASPSGNIDIISFTAVNSNTVYAFPAQSFI